MRCQPTTIAILIGCITTAAFNSLGWLPISERKLYDYYLRSRPLEPQDKKIVIVGLNEKDIEKLSFPISDNTLAILLTKIKAQNPRAIGLDLHRNVNIGEENNKRLDNIFGSTPQLIGVEKADGGNPHLNSISPPTELEKLGQTGASEIIEDGENGVVRRGYLYVQKSNRDKTIPSLGLAVALKYLKAENIVPTAYGSQSWLKLNNAVFPMLETNRLFYSNQDIDNYQTIINYCNAKNKFLQVSISDVLENKIEDNFFQDKIVFIGTTAETIEDIYTTPYSYESEEENYDFTYGVEIHASMTSQIVSTALGDRTIIKFLPLYWQYSGLFILLITTSFSSWYLYTKNNFFPRKKIVLHMVYSIFSLIIILVIGYLLLLFGWWTPTVTALLLVISSEVCIYVFIKLDQLEQGNIILEHKVKQRTQALREAQKKILSQEKLAVYQKLAQYIAHEIKNKTNIIGLNIENSQTDIDELQLIVEDNSFLFEEIADTLVQSPQEIIDNLKSKLSRIKSINKKITLIISEIYNRGTENNNGNSSIDTDVDINQMLDALLSEAIEVCKIKYHNFKIAIDRNYDEDLQKLSCTTSEIERALDNIISNAIYHLYQKNRVTQDYQPKLSITTQNISNAIEIIIRDNGTGIQLENLDKIFQIFWTTKASPEGLGLGLHFAKELIEKHSGKILVDSIEGEYTEFTVSFPTDIRNRPLYSETV